MLYRQSENPGELAITCSDPNITFRFAERQLINDIARAFQISERFMWSPMTNRAMCYQIESWRHVWGKVDS